MLPPTPCPHPQSRSRKPSPSSIRDPAGAETPQFRGYWGSSPEKDDLGHPICKMGHNPGHHHGAVICLELSQSRPRKRPRLWHVVRAEEWSWVIIKSPLSCQAPWGRPPRVHRGVPGHESGTCAWLSDGQTQTSQEQGSGLLPPLQAPRVPCKQLRPQFTHDKRGRWRPCPRRSPKEQALGSRGTWSWTGHQGGSEPKARRAGEQSWAGLAPSLCQQRLRVALPVAATDNPPVHAAANTPLNENIISSQAPAPLPCTTPAPGP